MGAFFEKGQTANAGRGNDGARSAGTAGRRFLSSLKGALAKARERSERTAVSDPMDTTTKL